MTGTGAVIIIILLLLVLIFISYRIRRRIKKQADKLDAQENAIQLIRLQTSAAAAQTGRTLDSSMGPTPTGVPVTEPPPIYNPFFASQAASAPH